MLKSAMNVCARQKNNQDNNNIIIYNQFIRCLDIIFRRV